MNWEDILKRKGRDVKRPASRKEVGRKMSGFNQRDADRAKKERDKLMNSPEAQRARDNQHWKKQREEYRNSPEYQKEQEEAERTSQRAEKYGRVSCLECGSEYITDENFKGKCDGKNSDYSGCGAENNFTVVNEGEMGNTDRYKKRY